MMCNTNNGTERLNEDLKYDELVGYKNCTPSDLLQDLLEIFIPKHSEKYIELNVKYTPGFRKYQQEISQYWQNQPKWYVLDLLEKQSRMTTYMIDSVKSIGNNKFHVSSERNESLSQEIKYEVYFGDESNYCYCSCDSFRKERVVCKHFFVVIRKGLKCFNGITYLYRFHPFTILQDDLFNIPDEINEEVVQMTSDDISPKNHLEGSNPTDSFDEPQNQEVVSVFLTQRGSTFKLKRMNLLANIKVFTEKCYNLNHLKTLLASLMPVLISLQES